MQDGTLTRARILIVDDEPANVRLLERLLGGAGYTHLTSTTDPRQILPLFSEIRPDLILLDLLMPQLDGFAIMHQLQPLVAKGSYLPILVLTADITPETKRRALTAGARDFLTKPFDMTEVLLRITNLLETRFLYLELQTQNERLEEQVRERTQRLLQTEKVATMGELLAGVAHELNNPLCVVTGRIALLRAQFDGGALGDQLDKVSKAADRCARIVRNFLALARQHPPERSQVQLNEVVKEAMDLVAYPLRVDSVEVNFDLADDLPDIWADAHQLHQVVVNLATNAQHAMREAGPPRQLTLTTGTDAARNRVILAVADSGPGIPFEVQARIFEPFFTTKPLGQGTGLGLSLCLGIIETHGGTMRVESQPGRGTVFVVELPVDRRGAEPAVETSEPIRSVEGKRVLVVDDEPEISSLLVDALGVDGHQVETAANGAVALQMLQAGPYDVIVSDLRMPELDGPGLYREVERRYPELAKRFIFLSGDTLTAQTRELLEGLHVQSVSKPFEPDEVRRAISRVSYCN